MYNAYIGVFLFAHSFIVFCHALRTIVLKVRSLGLAENTDANHTYSNCTVTMPYEKEANITIHVYPAYPAGTRQYN